jgi:hypothetical protein
MRLHIMLATAESEPIARPEWCFVVEEESRHVGRAALWALPGMGKCLALVLLDVLWEDDYLRVASKGVPLFVLKMPHCAPGRATLGSASASPPRYPFEVGIVPFCMRSWR